MRKLTFFALALVAGASLFTSCKKDEATSPAPTISFTNNETSKELNFTSVATIDVTFNVTVAAEGEISTFTAKKKVSGTSVNITPAPADFAGKTSYTYNYTGTFLATDTYPVELIFTVTDKEDQTTEKIYTITKYTASAGTTLAYENTSGVVWNLIGANQGAWDLAANAGVSSGGTETSKDMKNTSTVALGWVNAWTTGTGNTTLYVKAAAGFDYTAATVESATAAYAAGTGAATVTSPAQNDIYIAKLRGGSNYAVIKITSVVETPSDNLDKIAFSYKKLASTSGQ
ncbi:MAG: hypothetical protein HY951_08705 [Bacteroidia bacterium]|nr:hypothetical protein [Bacteroidia bacterium]